MAGEFTAAEKSKALRYLGYPDFEALGPSISFGFPSASQPLFILHSAFVQLSQEGRSRVREDLARLDELECLLARNSRREGVMATGDVKLDPHAARKGLIREFKRWILRLADDLGSPPNPMSRTFAGGSMGNRVVNS